MEPVLRFQSATVSAESPSETEQCLLDAKPVDANNDFFGVVSSPTTPT